MSYEDVIENRIQEPLAAGAFSGLPGEGRPLRFDTSEDLVGENWLGYKILRDNATLPAWLLLAREIERDGQALAALEARHSEWVEFARDSGDWERHAPALRNLASRIRDKVNQFANDPISLSNNVKALVGSPYIRMRVGDWRVIVSFDNGRMIILVIEVGHRREVYR